MIKVFGKIAVFFICLNLWFGASFAQPTPETIAQQLQASAALVSHYQLRDEDLRAIYQQRDFKPIWNTESSRGRRGIQTFVKSLDAFALYHGLNPEQLPFPMIERVMKKQDNTRDHLRLELLLTDLLIKLTRRIRGDDLNLADVYKTWSFPKREADYLPALIEAIQTGKIDQHFKAIAPTSAKYKRLAVVLRTYRQLAEDGGWNPIPYGKTIVPGIEDDRVPLVYDRLEAEGYDVPDERTKIYTAELQEAVILYQLRNSLKPDAEVGTNTVRAMNVSAERRVKQIAANMERIRQLPQSYEGRRVEVNAANGWLKIFDDKELTYEAPVIVGSRWRQTPFIHSEIKTLILNPSWYVPASIAKNDILKKLQKNPNYLAENNYYIQDRPEDPHGLMVDWQNMTWRSFDFFLRQAPSGDNALGTIKFNFENPYAVYLHHTNKLELFEEAERHLSSGCVRVKDPLKLAEIFLDENITIWDRHSIEEELANGKTRWLTVVGSPLIQIIYDSVYFLSENEPVQFARDLYRHDSRLIKTLWPPAEIASKEETLLNQ